MDVRLNVAVVCVCVVEGWSAVIRGGVEVGVGWPWWKLKVGRFGWQHLAQWYAWEGQWGLDRIGDVRQN